MMFVLAADDTWSDRAPFNLLGLFTNSTTTTLIENGRVSGDCVEACHLVLHHNRRPPVSGSA